MSAALPAGGRQGPVRALDEAAGGVELVEVEALDGDVRPADAGA